MRYADWPNPVKSRNDRRWSEPAVARFLDRAGPSIANVIADSINRDRTTVYRCLLRMKKRGQVMSKPIGRGTGNPHEWWLA